MYHPLATFGRRPGHAALRALGAIMLSFAVAGGVAAPAGAMPITGGFTVNARSSQQVTDGYTPAQIETAYDITPLRAAGIDGAGKTIAFIELDGYRAGDIAAFDAAFGLPAARITTTYQGGKRFRVPNQGETTMDLEWAHALAPGANLRVYYLKDQEATPSSWKAMATAITTAVRDGATSISISIGTCRPTAGSSATTKALARAQAKGVTTFVASGDTGPLPGYPRDCGRRLGAGYPASDPSVVAVGGTSLRLNPDNTVAQESAWDLSGGGAGRPILRPVWQIAPTLAAGKYRQVPDVSFLADPGTGVAMYLKGRWVTTGGTSLGAPAWAAIWTLLSQNAAQTGAGLPAGPATFYRLGAGSISSQALRDVTTGGNARYIATGGWDPVTGWGTPDVARLASVITAVPPR